MDGGEVVVQISSRWRKEKGWCGCQKREKKSGEEEKMIKMKGNGGVWSAKRRFGGQHQQFC